MKKNEEKTKKSTNQNEKTSDSFPEKKNLVEEVLKNSSDEILAKAIQDMLKKDMLH